MRRWFLSYSSQDFAVMQTLKSVLQRREADSHIFFAPEIMRAGGFWQQQLSDEIARSTAFVLLVGEKGIGPWQVMEYHEALDRRVKEPNYPLILILSTKRPAPGLPFVRQLHWVPTEDPGSEATVGKLIDAASGPATRPGELWRHTRPYRGLEAMTETNSDFFFGRERETVEVINALASERGKLTLLLGNSGVGKSSLAQAGVLAALLRQEWPDQVKDAGTWPTVFDRSRHWCFLTLRPGTDPLKALVEVLLERWQFKPGSERIKEQNELIRLLRDGNATLPDLLDETEKRHRELKQPSPPVFFLYIDQGEELYVRAEKQQRRQFSKIIATGLADSRLRALMSLRADFFGELLNDEALFGVHQLVKVPPLHEAQLREVVSQPAELLSARFQTDTLPADIAQRTAEESAEDGGALPLLSYLLDDMWSEMVQRGDGVLRLPMPGIDLGRVLVERANKFVAEHPAAEEALRHIFTLKLAAVREDGEPTRRRAARSEFTDEEWRLISKLADHPNRLLVTATSEGGETYAEVAHEAIFRRWDKLRNWIIAERDFLMWKSGVERDRHAWNTTQAKADALLMGYKLTQAQSWLATRARDVPHTDRKFIELSVERDAFDHAQREGLRRRSRQVGALASVLFIGIATGLAWSNRDYLEARAVVLAEAVWPLVLSAEDEQALRPGKTFKECAHCPEMVVVPDGKFMLGKEKSSADGEAEKLGHSVTITREFAVSVFEVTFEEWDACAILGGCTWPAPDTGWGRGRRPVMNVNWDDAQQYVAWLSRRTGKPYRLLSEAEWEYAARADSEQAYSWGDETGKNNANCIGCGSEWDGRKTAPAGSFAANKFGLYDMLGNVFEWTNDCWQDKPQENGWTPPAADGDCSRRVVRGGAWNYLPSSLRLAYRNWSTAGNRNNNLGFRVGRTLSAGAGDHGSTWREPSLQGGP
jgi:formylglycine-generating enzyme required for sulfatase activity/energy-coupling factor transporter ATP-binding protein EcfA2